MKRLNHANECSGSRSRGCRLPSAMMLAVLAGSSWSSNAQAQSAEPFPAVFELSSLLPINGGDGLDGFVLNGLSAVDVSGYSVSSAGDVNGDGIDDLIIGARQRTTNGLGNSGWSFVAFGAPGVGADGEYWLGDLNGIILLGIDYADFSGTSVSSAGDVNGDGFDDLIIGAPGAYPGFTSTSESYVVFGAAEPIEWFELSSLNGPNGFVLNGIDAGDRSGHSVSSAGDVNGDGFDDLIIGAHGADPNGDSAAGESYVVFGAADLGDGGLGTDGSFNLSALNGPNGFVLNGIDKGDWSGSTVSTAGDVNGDGIDDLIISAERSGTYPKSFAGESYVVFGAADLGAGGVGTGGSFNLSALNGLNGFILYGVDADDQSGVSVSSAGDVNGDGIDDLIIGAHHNIPFPYGESTGMSYVVFGAADLGSGGVGTGGTFNLSSLNGLNGFVLNGVDANDQSGHSVSAAGDVNGDWIDDLIIGAHDADPNGNSAAGESYVVFGAADLGSGGVGTGGSFNLSSLNGINGFVLNGIDPGDWSGWSVSTAGDVNGDGIADLIIGARRADPNGRTLAGESYVVFGRDYSPCLPDLNRDGIVDLGDITTFIPLFLDQDPAADFNGDGILDLGDIQAFITAFLDGC